MQKSIFFSWQAEIKPNRNFIESCIKKAIESLKTKDIHLDIAIDRDTIGSIGTVEIANTIFSKIDNSTIFIADVSFIASTENGRKLPNPNVLIELGYAANVLGWQNIITLINAHQEKVEELPFDIRHRRHIAFNALPNIHNSASKTALIKDLASAISPILEKEIIKDSIINHFKLKIDETIFKICSSVYYLLFGYDKDFFLNELWMLLKIDKKTIESKLKQDLFGFSLFKEFGIYREQIEKAYENPKYSKFLTNKQILNFMEISNCLDNLERFLTTDISRIEKPVERTLILNKIKTRNYTSLDRFNLVENNEQVDKFIDAGYFYSDNKEFLLSYYTLGISSILLVTYFYDLLKNIDAVTSSLGNKIIIDPSKIWEP